MSKLVVIGPSTVVFDGCIANIVRKILCEYTRMEEYNITTILTTDTKGVPEIARCYAQNNDLCMEVYPTNGVTALGDVLRAMIRDGDFLLIFAYNTSRCAVIKLAQYGVRYRKSVNVIPLIF